MQARLQQVKRDLDEIQKRLTSGCGNHGCVVKRPVGMGTNSACKCTPFAIARALQWTAEAIKRGGHPSKWEEQP